MQMSLFGAEPKKKTARKKATTKRKPAAKKRVVRKAVKISSKKTLNSNQYLVLSGVDGKTNIKSLEKRFKGEYRVIGGKNVIVRELKKAASPKKKVARKRKPSTRVLGKQVTSYKRKLKTAKKKLTKARSATKYRKTAKK